MFFTERKESITEKKSQLEYILTLETVSEKMYSIMTGYEIMTEQGKSELTELRKQWKAKQVDIFQLFKETRLGQLSLTEDTEKKIVSLKHFLDELTILKNTINREIVEMEKIKEGNEIAKIEKLNGETTKNDEDIPGNEIQSHSKEEPITHRKKVSKKSPEEMIDGTINVHLAKIKEILSGMGLLSSSQEWITKGKYDHIITLFEQRLSSLPSQEV